ncbi:cellulose-binding protein [Streptomyces sp. WI04-05B]|uniref:cellulose-binding protein n=1 Tax=Streptomyces TaxID=1883 RepID=UPI0029A164F1|nr:MULTISPECIES: cellulose-binding protein [unclassified Streptomyces]MDX2544383.1 cellulose-binding protein [Streptomyces sp. WI04-05B]MDX2588548.1 cellulose-binding protein [Streptomyces sp. WI04-05A]
MSGAAMSHGFVAGFGAGRGRGYRPDQVDAYAAALSAERDAAWERAARLTVLAREMDVESERLREVVSALEPQTYDTLGERARRLFELGVEEATAVREWGRSEARQLVAAAEAHADALLEAAGADAETVRTEAEERARHRLLAARAEADEIRIGARREVKEGRGEALAALREMRLRTSGLLAEQEKEYAERWAEAERLAAGREVALEARNIERVAVAEAALSEAERAFAEAEGSVGRTEEDARIRAAEILAEARVQEERLARETERVLREHGQEWDDVQAHMDHVRSSLTTLTGRAAAE